MRSKSLNLGLVASAAVFALSILFFFRFGDPMVLPMAIVVLAMGWTVALVFYVFRRRPPVRAVQAPPPGEDESGAPRM